ncbi:MAG: ABC transporter permease, partial [Bacteroidota bacterium]
MAEHPSQGPPSWPLRFLRLILRPDFVEEIEGDMEELFQDHLENSSPARARRSYAWEVFRLIRPSLLRPLLRIPYQPVMFKNHLIVALRVFSREKLYTLVNIIGMALGMTLALLILGYVQYELSYEALNPNADRLVRITMDYLDGETVVDQDCETYPPLGPMCKRVIPEVEAYVRTYGIDQRPVRVGDKFFSEPMIYAADSSFFRLFNYPLLFGSEEDIFRQPFEVVLTQSMARKFFGKTDVVGEEIFFVGAEPAFIIRGVVPDSPPNTHLKFNILISYRTMEVAFGESNDNWGGNNTFTYLLLNRADQYPAFERSLEELNVRLVTEEKIESEQVIAQPIKDIHLYSNKSFEPEINGDARSVFFLFGVGILVIVIAIVNYINLSTSKSLDRAQEVGIRKVLGSSMTQLRSQFFMEALLINALSAGLAVGLIALAWPTFQQMADLPKAFQFGANANFWLALLALIGISTLLSGIFPAFILSSFEPISVLKGRFAHSGRGLLLRKVLVVFQFGITIFLLAQTLTANRQLQYLRDIDLGVDIEQTIVVRAPEGDALEERYSIFRDQILNYPDFESVSLSNCVPGMPSHQMSTTTGIQIVGAAEEHNYNFYLYFHDAAFLSTMKMTLLAGDNFIANATNELQVMINEEAMRLWGISTPAEAIGKQLDFWGDKRTIIGVVK